MGTYRAQLPFSLADRPWQRKNSKAIYSLALLLSGCNLTMDLEGILCDNVSLNGSGKLSRAVEGTGHYVAALPVAAPPSVRLSVGIHPASL